MATSANAPECTTFDFITDLELRRSLQSDYRELSINMESGSWKAAHVLAGSIVEAVLVDHLSVTNYLGPKPVLEMDLGSLIAACKQQKIISERTAELSSVVRSYRNLIHPGRLFRLKEKITKQTAVVAQALVDIVAADVAKAKAETYGFTAEQIANKVENDSSAVTMLSHYLKETNDSERMRLVAQILPERYFWSRDDGLLSNASIANYRSCYRQTFESLRDEQKTEVLKPFIKILREEPGEKVCEYESMFFKASYMKYLADKDAAFAKAHLIARLKSEKSRQALDIIEGIGEFLDEREVAVVADALVRNVAYQNDPRLREAAHVALLSLVSELNQTSPAGQKLSEQLDFWIDRLGSNDKIAAKEILESTKAFWEEGIPF